MRKSICAVLPFLKKIGMVWVWILFRFSAMLMQAAVLYFRTYAEQCVHAGVVAA